MSGRITFVALIVCAVAAAALMFYSNATRVDPGTPQTVDQRAYCADNNWRYDAATDSCVS
jgi:hypothetical protein